MNHPVFAPAPRDDLPYLVEALQGKAGRSQNFVGGTLIWGKAHGLRGTTPPSHTVPAQYTLPKSDILDILADSSQSIS
jgi:hypothetical protein